MDRMERKEKYMIKKVSVIIPVYNAEKYLLQCIGSVTKQTLREIEIFCVDDGSTDSSLLLLKELQSQDQRIRVISQKNQGSAIARNHALQKAEGNYIAFVDADDYLLEETALERMYYAAETNQVAICGAFRSMDRGGCIVPMHLHRGYVAGCAEGKKMAYAEYQCDYHFQNYIYSRRLLLENQIWFPNYRRFQDPPFFVKAMIAADEFFIVPAEYYCYRCDHQNYQFNYHKVRDIVQGLIDILQISKNAGLKKLHQTAVMRLNESYFWDIVGQCNVKNIEFIDLLLRANSLVQWEWIHKDYCVQCVINPLQWILQAVSDKNNEYQECLNNKYKYGYVVPFYKLQPGAKIILYAAGSVGRAYYEQLKNHVEYEVVLWVDRNWHSLGKIDEVELKPVERILQIEYDYILISVEDYESAQEIMKLLEKIGIDRRKMIWGVY